MYRIIYVAIDTIRDHSFCERPLNGYDVINKTVVERIAMPNGIFLCNK